MKMDVTFASVYAISTLAALTAGAEAPLEWPQFRGLGGSGIADEQHPPTEFDPNRQTSVRIRPRIAKR